jgi:hypothetical protein
MGGRKVRNEVVKMARWKRFRGIRRMYLWKQGALVWCQRAEWGIAVVSMCRCVDVSMYGVMVGIPWTEMVLGDG